VTVYVWVCVHARVCVSLYILMHTCIHLCRNSKNSYLWSTDFSDNTQKVLLWINNQRGISHGKQNTLSINKRNNVNTKVFQKITDKISERGRKMNEKRQTELRRAVLFVRTVTAVRDSVAVLSGGNAVPIHASPLARTACCITGIDLHVWSLTFHH